MGSAARSTNALIKDTHCTFSQPAMTSIEEVCGVDRVEFTTGYPFSRYPSNASDSQGDFLGRLADARVVLSSDPGDDVPTAAELTNVQFEVRYGFLEGFLAGDPAAYGTMQLATSNIVTDPGTGRVTSFEFTRISTGTSISRGTLDGWQGGTTGTSEYHIRPKGSGMIDTRHVSLVFDFVILSSMTGSVWEVPPGVDRVRIPLHAFPEEPVYPEITVVSGVRSNRTGERFPRMPLQVPFQVNSLTHDVDPVTLGGRLVLDVTIIHGDDSPAPLDATIATVQGGLRRALYITLGGHSEAYFSSFAVSESGAKVGSPTSILPGQSATFPSVGQPVQEYEAGGLTYASYPGITASTIADNTSSAIGTRLTATFTFPNDAIVQTSDLRIVNVSYLVGDVTTSAVAVSAYPSDVTPPAVVFGPLSQPTDAFTDIQFDNTPVDMPSFVLGGSLEPLAQNGGPDGFRTTVFVAGPNVPPAQGDLTGAAAAALDVGVTLDAALCPFGVPPPPPRPVFRGANPAAPDHYGSSQHPPAGNQRGNGRHQQPWVHLPVQTHTCNGPADRNAHARKHGRGLAG